MKDYTYVCKDGRVRTIRIYDDGTRKTISYPRILMEEKLGRLLRPDEDVHHIDGNPLNNDINNLAIIEHSKHDSMHTRKYYDKYVECQVCHKIFLWTAKKQSTYQCQLNQNKNRGICCSRRCSYWFGKCEYVKND